MKENGKRERNSLNPIQENNNQEEKNNRYCLFIQRELWDINASLRMLYIPFCR